MAPSKLGEGEQKGLVPSQDEVRKIMAKVFQAYPAQAPVILMQIEVARMMQNFIEKLKGQLEKSIQEMEDDMDKLM